MNENDGEGARIYFAPTGTAPPTPEELLRGENWTEFDPRAAERARTTALTYTEAEDTIRSWDDFSASLELVYQKPEPYRPNRAERRAAARRRSR